MLMERNPRPRSKIKETPEFSYPIIKTYPLPRPDQVPDISFFKTILSRRSGDLFSGIKIEKLSQLLFYSAKTIEVNSYANGMIYSKRPTPSAGGIHPIDIVTTVLDDNKSRYSYYDPLTHSLNELDLPLKVATDFKEHIRAIKPEVRNSIMIWMVAHEYRTSAKYVDPASLVWRDAGCLLYCISLVCTALEIKCCPIGSLGEPYVSTMFRKFGTVYGAGGCLVG